MAGKTQAAASTTGAFVLDEKQLAAIEPKARGRSASPSEFLAEVESSLSTGDAMGIRITATRKATWIAAQLRKAGKQLTDARTDGKLVKVQIWDRSEVQGMDPFVGFKAQAVDKPAEDAKTNESPAA